jgi:ferredoxin
MLHPHVDTFVQYNARPRSSEVRALCWCSGDGVCEERVDWKQIDVDMAAYNARRVFRDHDILHDFMREYAACAASRPDLFENESAALAAWRDAFVQNSIAFAAENKAHAALVAEQDVPAPDESSNKRQRLVRFSEKQ